MKDFHPNPSDTTPIGKVLNALSRADRRINRTGPDKYMAQCPGPNHVNGDQHPSLSIGIGNAGGCVMRCMSGGCANEGIVETLGLAIADLMAPDSIRVQRPPRAPVRNRETAKNGGGKLYATMGDAVKGAAWIMAKAHNLATDRVREAGTWEYRDAGGAVIAAVVRVDLPTVGEDGKPDKDFRPVHRVAGGWRIGDPAGKWPLYRLPEVLAAVKAGAQRVYVVEGEKACDSAWACGLVATTSAHGAKSPGRTDWMPLAGAGVEVVILPDNDEAGRGYADAVAGILSRLAPAVAVKAVDLPDLPAKGDFHDFQATCRDGQDGESIRAEVEALSDSAPAWEPAPVDSQAPEAPVDVSEAMPVLVRMADVTAVPVRWLWPGRIAIGKVTMFAGDPGLGKSFLTLDMAARVSTGRPWPDCPTINNPAGGVVLLNCEDDLADTIRPRLDKASADCARIIALLGVRLEDVETGKATERAFSLDRDLPRLEVAIKDTPGCRLVVIDPITGYLGETDSHKNAEIRALLAPLSAMAAKYGVAVVCVSHLNKGNGPAMYRTMGSLAFVAAARAAWAVTRDKDDLTGTRRLVLPVKNNLGPDNTGLAYALVDGSVRWEDGVVTVTADEALAQDTGGGEDQRDDTELAHATEWLRELLKPSPMLAKEVLKQARECGISERTTNRAKREAGVEAYRPVNPGPWFWRMPGSTLPTPSIPPDVGNVPNVGNVPANTGVSAGGNGADCQGGDTGKVLSAGVLVDGILDTPLKPKRKRKPIPDAGMRKPSTEVGK